MKVKRVRVKACQVCHKEKLALYRVRGAPTSPWQFVCNSCLEPIREGNLSYQYGGTWKSKKRH